ncbi:anoctamin-4-like [Culicoides brevitarsis]|uniref:anoctamin-4-like n=1 Tax=Culicoides brevitarsis TaxID=469753 RepID=UPI00307B890C
MEERIQINQTTSDMAGHPIDYILVYKNDEQQLEEKHEIIRSCFLYNLKLEGLEFEIDAKREFTFVKIYTNQNVLRKYAELLRWKLPATHRSLKKLEETESQKQYKYFDNVRTDYKIHYYYSKEMSYLFNDDEPDFFKPGFRTVVVENILLKTRFDVRLDEVSGDTTPTNSPMDEHCEKGKPDICCVGIQKLIHDGVFVDRFSLHDGSHDDESTLRGQLWNEWASLWKWNGFQPLDKIKEYFGAQVALYFAWLGFYTHMLIPASIAGIICLAYGWSMMYKSRVSEEICDPSNDILICPQCDRTCDFWRLRDTCTYARISNLFDNDFTIFFAIAMCLWTTLLLELWKRYSSYLVHNWGLSDYTKRVEPKRPEYLEFLSKNGGIEKTSCTKSPPRPLRFVLSYSASIFFICLVLIITFGIIIYRMSLNAAESIYGHKESITYKITVLPATGAVINLIAIKILNYFYYYAAVFLTERELHRTQTEYDESLGLKIYLFQFFNYYSSIFYLALIKGKMVGYPGKYIRIFGLRQEECGPTGCMLELFIQLVIIMVGKQIIYTLQEILWEPFWGLVFKILGNIKAWMMKTKKERSQDQWFKDNKLTSFTYMTLFNEYLEIIMQFGFVTLFVVAFPLAPLFALLNNIFELRWDAKKFLKYYRKPITRRARNIGVWYNIMQIICRLSVLMNSLIIAFSSNFIPKIVYTVLKKTNHTDSNSYLNFTLSQFATKDFENGSSPLTSIYNNTEFCHYPAFRFSPDDEEDQYKPTVAYWYVLVGRLAFIVVFQNIVGFIQIFVDYAIPDMPARLKERIRHEEALISEIINEGKFGKVGKKLTKCIDELRARKKKSVVTENGNGNLSFIENTKV